MRYTRKRPICASTRNKWVEHPVTRFYDGAHHNLSSYFLYEGKNVVAMINPVYDKKTDTLAYRLDVVDPNTGKSRTIEEQCTSSREAMDVYDERKDYFINESTKTRKVECSMRERASVRAAMTDDEFYTRKFPTVKVGEVKVAPQRGNWTVFIGLSDGTIAYQWCESKEAARRESEYAKSIVKKYGSDAPYWAEEGYKIWNPNVKSAKKPVSCTRRFTVKASINAKRRMRVCAATEYPYLYVLKHGYGPGTLPKNVEVGRVEDYKGYTLVWLNRFLTTSELNEYDIPAESQLERYLGDDLERFMPMTKTKRYTGNFISMSANMRKRVSASKRMRKSIKASADEAYWSDGKWSIYKDGNEIVISDGYYTDYAEFIDNGDVRVAGYTPEMRVPKSVERKLQSLVKSGKIKRPAKWYDDIESSTSIKCAEDDYDPKYDARFSAESYYGSDFRGLEDDIYTDDWSEVEEWSHEKLMRGGNVVIEDRQGNGGRLEITADEYNEAWENGAADFDINEDIVEFKNRIINSAESIKCSDNTDLTVDISNLELGEPKYELREDDPETPDQWVLVIGKDPEKQMNFKLWYYMDSTDADLTELDLNNPDHIDLDEMSTMDDYDEIQLAEDIKCSTVTDVHGNPVNLVTM